MRAGDYIQEKIKLPDFQLLNIKLSHLKLILPLHFYHNDPFDRLLIAQAIVENISIISQDTILIHTQFTLYGESAIAYRVGCVR